MTDAMVPKPRKGATLKLDVSHAVVPKSIFELNSKMRGLTNKAVEVLETAMDMDEDDPVRIAAWKVRIEAAKHVLDRGWGPARAVVGDNPSHQKDPFLEALMPLAHFRDGSSAAQLMAPDEVIDVYVEEDE